MAKDGKITESENFRKWFGNSKVVDSQGNPLVVYHGTTKDFTIFSLNHATKQTGIDWGKLGFFFTSNKSLAEDFTRYNWGIGSKSKFKKNSKLLSCYLSIKNPKIVNARQWTLTSDNPDVIRKELISQGYDGYIIEPLTDEDKKSWINLFGTRGIKELENIQYVAFYPNQIKLSDGTNITFDGGNPDIRFKDGGKMNKYEGKQRWAENRMAKNREIDTLTEEQHDVLADLCSVRHDIHSNKRSIIVSDESKRLQKLIEINEQIKDSGLDYMEFIPTDTSDYIDIDSIYFLEETEDVPEDDSERQDWYDSNYVRISGELEILNDKIEKYLIEIDKKYKTNYAPSGMSRFEYGGRIYNGLNVPNTINPNLVISAFSNPIDEEKVEKYTAKMQEEMLSHDFPPIMGFPTEIDENDIGDYFLNGNEITEDDIGKRAWKVTDGHHRTLSAINAHLPYIRTELDFSTVTNQAEYFENGGEIVYHGTSPKNAKAIFKYGFNEPNNPLKAISVADDFDMALEYADDKPLGVIAVRVKKDAKMLGEKGDRLTGEKLYRKEDLTPIGIGKSNIRFSNGGGIKNKDVVSGYFEGYLSFLNW